MDGSSSLKAAWLIVVLHGMTEGVSIAYINVTKTRYKTVQMTLSVDRKPRHPVRSDLDKLKHAAEPFLDVMSEQQAQVWIGAFDFGWPNKRIAKALGIKDGSVRSVLYEARRVVADNPPIAYRTIQGIDGVRMAIKPKPVKS